MLKIYEAKNLYFATNIKVGENDIRRVEFKSGVRVPKVINGTFVTDDGKLQEAIEKDPSYGVKFSLKQSVGDNTPADVNLEDMAFATVAAAKEWLNKEKGISTAKLANRAAVIAEAKALGYNLTFDTDKV